VSSAREGSAREGSVREGSVREGSPVLDYVVLAAAVVATVASMFEWTAVHYAAKPVATLACAAMAWHGGRAVSARYRALIVTGLLLGTAGDVLLMLPGDRFVAGLAAFLVGHLCYIGAFVTDVGWQWRAGMRPFVVLALMLTMLATIGPRLGPLFAPVAVYALVIGTMAWQAAGRRLARGAVGANLASWGAISFVASDFTLALVRFGTPFRLSPLVILGTYWTAQYLIARSVHDAG
jgi:uncharacterized membrane protein YhhN